MSLINRAATFRGRIVDHGVNLSPKQECPQWVASLLAQEIYDEETETWVAWPVEESEITAYQVLFSSKGETLNVQQVKKITDWDGASFEGLAGLDLSEAGIQFRVEENIYEEKTRLQVAWIDEYDAQPGRTVRKLNPEELKQVDAMYKKFLKPVAPVAAKKTKPTTPGKVTKKGIKPTQPKAPVTKVPPVPEVKSDIPETSGTNGAGSCTKSEAWNEVVKQTRDRNIKDEVLSKTWLTAVKKYATNNDPDTISEEDWFQVQTEVLDKLVGIPF